ncbi:MAG: 3'-5' exonuclease, partial [Hyphomonadaceae bacterium]
GWARVFARLGQEARDPLAELLERALHPGREAAPTLQRFLADIEGDAVDVKREMEEAGQAVRVMTVHAAKGLEAPVVILPDTTGPAKQTAENGLIIDKSGLYWSPSEKEDDAATAEARAAHKARARSEHLRLLYVAMTRARDRLIVCGFGRGRGEGAAADESWHARVFETLAKIGAPMETPFGEGYRLGQPLFAAVPPEAGHEQMNAPAWARARHGAAPAAPRAAPSRLKPADPATLSPRRAGGARFRRGKLIHGLLQRLPELEAARRPAAAEAWLKRQGVSEEEAAALAREALGVLNAPGLAAAFGPGSRAEAPLAGRAAGLDVRGVVDRLVVTAAEAMIIDFKSDRPAPLRAEDAPAGYVLQMALYRALIAQIFPDRPVRCAIIWTERPHLTELSPKQLESALAAFARG